MDLEFYKEHGWVHIPNIIPEDYLQAAKAIGPGLVRWGRTNIGKPTLAGPPNHNVHVGCAGAYEGVLMNLYTSKFSYDLATSLIGKKDIFLFNDQMVYKFPGDQVVFDAHYDNQFGNENKNGKMHTVNISWILDDMTEENGTLRLKSLKTEEWTTVYPKAGDIVAINGNCLHQSGPNNSDKPRGLYACVYSEGQINLAKYYTDPFLVKDTTKQHIHTLVDDIVVQQFAGFKDYFRRFLELNKFDRILELGTSFGGLTYYLSTIFDGEILTVDNYVKNISKKVYGVARVMEADHLSIDTQKVLHRDFLSKEGKTLVLCDGGDKPRIFNAYAKLIKQGDVIAVHDYFENKKEFENQEAWSWCECIKEEIISGIENNKLVEQDKFMKDIVWAVFKKTSEKVVIPNYSSYI